MYDCTNKHSAKHIKHMNETLYPSRTLYESPSWANNRHRNFKQATDHLWYTRWNAIPKTYYKLTHIPLTWAWRRGATTFFKKVFIWGPSSDTATLLHAGVTVILVLSSCWIDTLLSSGDLWLSNELAEYYRWCSLFHLAKDHRRHPHRWRSDD